MKKETLNKISTISGTAFITIVLLFIISLICEKCSSEKEIKENYYKVEFEVYPEGRTDTIHRVLYTAHGPLNLFNYQVEGRNKPYLSSPEDKIIWKEYNAFIKITNQEKITKEVFDNASRIIQRD